MIALAAYAVLLDARLQTFEIRLDKPAQSVSLAGSFNGWNPTATPLKADADGRTWRGKISLPYGRQTYKFVIDGREWRLDPKAPSLPDGAGNVNSVVLVLPDDYDRPAIAGDGVVAASALRHETGVPDLNVDRGRLRVSFRVRPDDVNSVTVVAGGRRVAMREVARDEVFARYRADLPYDGRQELNYRFEVRDGGRVIGFGPDGAGPAKGSAFVASPKTVKPFVTPEWVEGAIVYQIFPDRFANGTKANDPADVQPWDGKPTWFNRFGGDAVGITQRVGYLRDLGVGAVYFNPVFASPSNHRYDTSDYHRIDPQIGTEQEFVEMAKTLDRAGIRSVLDLVLNHSATDFGPFMDLRQKGAESKYRDWFFVKSFPIEVRNQPNYEAWFGFPSMPKLNVMNPAAQDYLLDVFDFWHARMPLGGARLDVANEVDPRFWRLFRQRVKKTNPNAWIVGEVWTDASAWLKGDQWDAAMNYPFRDLCLRYFAYENLKPSEMGAGLMSLYERHVPQVSRVQMNLLGSHDTERFRTMCGGDAAKHHLAAILQFGWVGAPTVYYGDELGMEGGRDPENRRGMRWDLVSDDNPTLRLYRRLAAARRASKALQSGDPSVLVADDARGLLALGRTFGTELAIVVLNRSDKPQTLDFPLPREVRGGFVNALTGSRVKVDGRDLSLRLAAKEGALLLPASKASPSLISRGSRG